MEVVENKKIRTIEIMRIIAALGVFTGHFLGIGIASEYSCNVLRYMRNSWIGKSVLAYFFEGDISVIFFYVVGGFFITYNYFGRNQTDKKMQIDWLRKIIQIVVPSIFIIFFTALLSYPAYVLGINTMFSAQELKLDIVRILFGGGEDYIPYYAYQLWYIHRMVVGYLYAYAFLGLTSKYLRLRYMLYIPIILYFYMSYIALAFIFMGVMCGDVCVHLLKKKGLDANWKKIIGIMVICIAIIAGPMIYNEHSLGAKYQFGLSVCMALVITVLVLLYRDVKSSNHAWHKMVDWLNDNNFSFYCIHVVVLYVSRYIYYRILSVWKGEEGILLFLMYVVTLVCTVLSADIFRKIVIKNVSRGFDWCTKFF